MLRHLHLDVIIFRRMLGLAELRHIIVKLGLDLGVPVHSVVKIRLRTINNQSVIISQQILQFSLKIGNHLSSLFFIHILYLL